MKRSRLIALTCLLATAVVATSVTAFFKTVQSGVAMTSAANAYISLLDEDQKKTSLMDYDTTDRLGWHFIPKDHRKGLQIKHMNKQQRKAAYKLLKTALSQAGYNKATTIMALEGVLDELEKKGKRSGNIRDAQRYYYTVFGTPSDKGRWGLSIEGHHLSLNFVVEGGKVVSSTPEFYAANPIILDDDYKNRIRKGTLEKGLRVLAAEETLAFELVNALDADQQKVAVLADKAPREIRTPGSAQPPANVQEGLVASKLNAKQKAILHKLIGEYASNMPADVAAKRLSEIKEAGDAAIHFAWAGAKKPGVGHYYRIEGKSFLIEFVNTQPDAAGNPASHIHAVWRDPRGDFAIPVK